MTLKPINRERLEKKKIVWSKPTWDFDEMTVSEFRKILDTVEAEYGSDTTMYFAQEPYSDSVDVEFAKIIPESDEAYEARMRKLDASREKTVARLQRQIEEKQAQLEEILDKEQKG